MLDIRKQFMIIAGRLERSGAEVSVCDSCERTYPEQWIFNNVCPFCGLEHTIGRTPARPRPEVEIDVDLWPTPEYLNWINNYDPDNDNIEEFLRALRDSWDDPEATFVIEGNNPRTLHLICNGSDRNYELVEALEGSLFWNLYWRWSDYQGHNAFILKPRSTPDELPGKKC